MLWAAVRRESVLENWRRASKASTIVKSFDGLGEVRECWLVLVLLKV